MCWLFFNLFVHTTIFTFFAHCVLKESFLSKDLDYQKDYTIFLYSLHVCFLLSFHKTFRNKKNLINWYNTKVLDIEYIYVGSCSLKELKSFQKVMQGFIRHQSFISILSELLFCYLFEITQVVRLDIVSFSFILTFCT